MKLLFDQNLSFRIVNKLINHFPGSKHVSNLGLNGSEDNEIWQFAQKGRFVIVTFDSDYYDLSLINGFPPKIIWLRTGNLATNEIAELLISKAEVIREFITSKEAACLEING